MQACAPLYVSQIQNLEIEGMFYDHGTPNGRCVVLNKNLSGSAQDVLQITNGEYNCVIMTDSLYTACEVYRGVRVWG